MFIEFRVGNFRSFKDPVILSLEAAKISSKEKSLDENNLFVAAPGLTLLKSAAIYGANASGKSNLVKSLAFMQYFVLNSSKDTQSLEPIKVEPFRLSDESINEPSLFEIVFIADGIQYRYGFEVTTTRVVAEWLFYVPKKRESRLFQRTEQTFELSSVFKEGKSITDKTRDNALFLSVVAQFNGEIAQRILGWFRKLGIIFGLNDNGYLPYTFRCLNEDKNRADIIHLIKELDLSISDVETETTKMSLETVPENIPDELKQMLLEQVFERHTIMTLHQRYSADGTMTALERFNLTQHESDGTQKIVALSGPLIDTLKRGRIMVIDEFDARLHPLITREIIKLFHSPIANPHHAQLIFMTHDTNLLDKNLFRRDQIWFTEKNRRGAGTLYSLVEYNVRNDASLRKIIFGASMGPSRSSVTFNAS